MSSVESLQTKSIGPEADALGEDPQAGSSRLAAGTTVVLSLVLLLCLSTLLWGLNRGLDFLDEGFYLLTASDPHRYPFTSSFGFLMHRLPQLLPTEIESFRLDYLIMQLASTAALCFGFLRWLKREVHSVYRRLPLSSLVLVTLLASLQVFSIFPAISGYNGLACACIVSSFGLLFFSLSLEQDSTGLKWCSFALEFASGMLLGLAFFAKFTAVLLALPLLFVAFLLCRPNDLGLWRTLLAIGLGIASGFLLYFTGLESYHNWYHSFQSVVLDRELSCGSHGLNQVFACTIQSIWQHKLELVVLALGVVAVVFHALFKRMSKRSAPTALSVKVTLAALALLICTWAKVSFDRGSLHSSLVYWPIAFVFLAGLTSNLSIRLSLSRQERIKLWSALGILSLLPFSISLGTDTPLFWHLLSSFAPLYMVTLVTACLLATVWRFKALPHLVALSAAAVLGVQFANGYLFEHKNCGSLIDNTHAVTSLDRIKGIYLTADASEYLQCATELLRSNGFKPDDRILAIYDSPALVYALHALSPGLAWYGSNAGLKALNSRELSHLRDAPSRGQILFLAVSNGSGRPEIDREISDSLSKSGIDFPADFRYLGTFKPHSSDFGAPSFFYVMR